MINLSRCSSGPIFATRGIALELFRFAPRVPAFRVLPTEPFGLVLTSLTRSLTGDRFRHPCAVKLGWKNRDRRRRPETASVVVDEIRAISRHYQPMESDTHVTTFDEGRWPHWYFTGLVLPLHPGATQRIHALVETEPYPSAEDWPHGMIVQVTAV
jgi:hypothetical protein